MATDVNAIIREDIVKVSDALTRPSNTTAYAAGEVISEVTSNEHFAFDGIAAAGSRSGTIVSAICQSSTVESTKPDLELWLFDSNIANVADNSAFAVADSDLLDLVGVIDFPIAEWKQGLAGASGTGNSINQSHNLNIRYIADSGNRIYGQLVVRNAYSPISAEVFTVILLTAQD